MSSQKKVLPHSKSSVFYCGALGSRFWSGDFLKPEVYWEGSSLGAIRKSSASPTKSLGTGMTCQNDDKFQRGTQSSYQPLILRRYLEACPRQTLLLCHHQLSICDICEHMFPLPILLGPVLPHIMYQAFLLTLWLLKSINQNTLSCLQCNSSCIFTGVRSLSWLLMNSLTSNNIMAIKRRMGQGRN